MNDAKIKRDNITWVVIMLVLAVIGYFGGDLGGWIMSKRLPPPKPIAPLKINFRPSAVSGLVLQVQNTSDNHLSCVLAVKNETQNQHQTYSFSVAPYKMSEIGMLECGWAFQHGESIGIATEGYQNTFLKVP